MYAQFAVAELLGMSVYRLRKELSASELCGWYAYLQIKKDNIDKARMNAEHKAKLEE